MSGAETVQPYLLAMLICDQVIVDEFTKKKTLVGVFDNLNVAGLPAQHPIGIYARLTDAEGQYTFRVEQVHVPTNKVVGHVEAQGIRIEDRLKAFEIMMQIGSKFDLDGPYEFRLLANGAYLGRASFTVLVRVPGA